MFGDAEIVDRCRSHLEALPGVRKATVKTPVRFTALPVDDLGLTLETDAGTLRYSGAAKRRLTSSHLDHWLLLALPHQQHRAKGAKLILFADYVSPAQAQRLRDAEVDYVDTAGNLLIHEPGKLYLFKSGARPERHGRPLPGRLFMPSGLQVLFVLLIEPSAVDLPYRELALKSGVALGSIAVLMNELKRQGYLVPGQKAARLVRRHELVARWVAGYGERLRAKLVLGVFSAAERDPAKNLERLASVLGERKITHAVTGGVAAEHLTHHYRGQELTVFVSEWPRGVAQQVRWMPSPEGSIVLLRQFCRDVQWRRSRLPHLAHPLLVYAELLHLGGERARETARMIYQQHLEALATDDAR